MATRYWVNGTGTWDNVSDFNWSETSGGSGFATIPTSADDVIFNSSSGTGSVSISTGAVCATITGNNNLTFSFGSNFLTVGSRKVTILTTGFNFTTPADWNNASNEIYLIAGGGGSSSAVSENMSLIYSPFKRAGGAGGGGGGCRVLTNQTISGVVPYIIGAGGAGGTASEGSENGQAGGDTSWNTTNIAIGGQAGIIVSTLGAPQSLGGAGGSGTFSGGNGGSGGTSTTIDTANTGGGGGGAAGKNGAGGFGGNGLSTTSSASIKGAGGGGNGGGSAGGNAATGLSGAGGNNSLGLGGAAGVSSTTGPGVRGLNGGGGSGAAGFAGVNNGGGRGSNGIEILGSFGSGSGGGSGGRGAISNTGLFGSGGAGRGVELSGTAYSGSLGGAGAIIIVYTPAAPPTYTVGDDEVANFVNTTSGQVINVTANKGLGDLGVVTRASLTGRLDLSFVIATDMQYPTINVSAIPGYIAGKSDVTITVNAGVYVYGYSFNIYNYTGSVPSPINATMKIIGGTAGDTIRLVNNGFILGAGGDGSGAINGAADSSCCNYSYQWTLAPSTPGQPALEITYPITLVNNGYIAGGGGGGASIAPGNEFYYYSAMGGGGGAGGGLGIDRIGTVAVRAVPPNVGNNGQSQSAQYGPCNCITSFFFSGGGGGFVLPGVGGLAQSGSPYSYGGGGGSGGAGSSFDRTFTTRSYNNNGGTANGQPPTYTLFSTSMQSGGGGGWGATGGTSYFETSSYAAGEPGGNSIITNGKAITTVTAGTQYGALRTNTTTYVTTLSSSATPTTVQIPGGASYTDVIIIVPAGVTLRSNNPGLPALFIENFSFDPILRLKIVVNGAILGAGGRGGSDAGGPESGGTAIEVNPDVLDYTGTITVDCTYGYVAGGGGGGGYVLWDPAGIQYNIYGGGGAGGGNSGQAGVTPIVTLGATTVGTSGSNGSSVLLCGFEEFVSGGGGGLILPGTSVSLGTQSTIASFPGIGGSGGGSGAARKNNGVFTTFANNGGGFNQDGGAGYNPSTQTAAGGGGGGWGSTGGYSRRTTSTIQAGNIGGAAINSGTGLPVYVINSANVAGYIG